MSGSVSVVLPAYDEESTIESTVAATLESLGSFLPVDAFEVIVAEDGCTDRTPEIAARLAAADDRVRHVHSDERLGRGGALERAFAAANGSTLVYFDTDLATDMAHLKDLVERVRSGRYDVATGSRMMAGHEATRPAKRGVPSRVYNGLVRTFLASALRDHQCGFKAFDREVLFDLLDDVSDTHWFWDTEVLVRAQRRGYRVAEFPVRWTPMGDTKVDLVRDVVGMGSGIVRLWWELSVRPRITRRRTLAAGTVLTLLALLLMTQYLDPGAVLEGMAAADPALIALATLVYLLSWPLRGLRYRDILSAIGYDEGTWFLTGAVFLSQTGNLVFPARAGDAVRAYIVKSRSAVPYPSGFASLAVERVFDLLTITALAGAVLLTLALSGFTSLEGLYADLLGPDRAVAESGRVAIVVATGVGIAAIATVVAIVASARAETNVIRRAVTAISTDSYAVAVASVLERFVGDVQTVASDRRAFARIGASSLSIWSIDVLVAVIVLAAFDVGLSAATLLAVGFFAVSVGNLAKVLPLSPGGIGLYEGAFTLLVVALTPITVPVALGAAIVDHAVKNAVTVAGGLVSMVTLNVSLGTAIDEGREATETSPESVETD